MSSRQLLLRTAIIMSLDANAQQVDQSHIKGITILILGRSEEGCIIGTRIMPDACC